MYSRNVPMIRLPLFQRYTYIVLRVRCDGYDIARTLVTSIARV